MTSTIMLLFALFPGNNNIFIESNAGVMVSVVHDRDYTSIEYRRLVVDPVTGGTEFEGFADWAICFTDNSVYIQNAWWCFTPTKEGNLIFEQDYKFYDLW